MKNGKVMNEFVTVIRPDLVWYDDNVNWLKHLVSSNGTEQKFFLQEMIEKKVLLLYIFLIELQTRRHENKDM